MTDDSSTSSQRGLAWLMALLVILLLLLIFWLTIGMVFSQRANSHGLVSVEPMAGGAVIPADTPISPPTPLNSANASPVDASPENGVVPNVENGADSQGEQSTGAPLSEQPLFVPNQAAIVTSQATADDVELMPILSAPQPEGQQLAVYRAGDIFTILEPDGDFTAYPVVVDGISWVRVQDRNGLVGWTKADMLETRPTVEVNIPPTLLIDQVRDSEQGQEAEPVEAPEVSAEVEPADLPVIENTAQPAQEPAPTSTPAG